MDNNKTAMVNSKKKIGFIIDSSCDLSLIKKYDDVYLIPLNIIVKSNDSVYTYQDDGSITSKELQTFFDKKANIRTSQANVADMIKLVEKMSKIYDEIYVFPISRNLSGNFNSWNMITELFPRLRIIYLDDVGCGISWTFSYLYDIIKKQDLSQKELQDIATTITKQRVGYVLITNYKQLIAGGRVKTWKASIANLLNLKPIVRFDSEVGLSCIGKIKTIDGFLEMIKKENNRSYANRKIKKVVCYCTKSNYKDEYEQKFHHAFGQFPLECTELSNTIACHIGNDYLAFYFWYE